MEFQYTKKLGYGRTGRFDPLISITLIGINEFDVYCLIDSGSQYNLFSIEVAKAAGIDLSDASEVEASVGGIQQVGFLKEVMMEFLGKQWKSNVVFCEKNEGSNLLGGESFFQYFDVRFRYFDLKFNINPAPEIKWE